jgi:hypothetical protein
VLGHTHYTTGFKEMGIRAVSNQRGYVLLWKTGTLIIDTPATSMEGNVLMSNHKHIEAQKHRSTEAQKHRSTEAQKHPSTQARGLDEYEPSIPNTNEQRQTDSILEHLESPLSIAQFQFQTSLMLFWNLLVIALLLIHSRWCAEEDGSVWLGSWVGFFGSFAFGTPEFLLSDVPLREIVAMVARKQFNADHWKRLSF